MLRRRSDPAETSGAERRGALADALARLEETLRRAEHQLQTVRSRARAAPAGVPPVARETPRTVAGGVPDVREEPPPPTPAPDVPAEPPPPTPAPEPSAGPEVTDSPDPAPAAERRGETATLFSRRVEVDVGPFGDFGALSSFERAVSRMAGVETVYVRRFFNDRAIVELSTADEMPLVGALRAALPWRFDVERTEWDSLKITLASGPAESG